MGEFDSVMIFGFILVMLVGIMQTSFGAVWV